MILQRGWGRAGAGLKLNDFIKQSQAKFINYDLFNYYKIVFFSIKNNKSKRQMRVKLYAARESHI